MSVGNFLQELWAWVLAVCAAVVTIPARVVWNNRTRSIQNKRQLQGDPDDPNARGVLDIAYETNERVKELARKQEEHHAEMYGEIQRIEQDIRDLAIQLDMEDDIRTDPQLSDD